MVPPILGLVFLTAWSTEYVCTCTLCSLLVSLTGLCGTGLVRRVREEFTIVLLFFVIAYHFSGASWCIAVVIGLGIGWCFFVGCYCRCWIRGPLRADIVLLIYVYCSLCSSSCSFRPYILCLLRTSFGHPYSCRYIS